MFSLVSTELKLRAVRPNGAFYMMVDISRWGSSLRVAETLLEHFVLTVPGVAFGSESEGFIRLAFCIDAAILMEGIKRIGKVLKTLTPLSGLAQIFRQDE